MRIIVTNRQMRVYTLPLW